MEDSKLKYENEKNETNNREEKYLKNEGGIEGYNKCLEEREGPPVACCCTCPLFDLWLNMYEPRTTTTGTQDVPRALLLLLRSFTHVQRLVAHRVCLVFALCPHTRIDLCPRGVSAPPPFQPRISLVHASLYHKYFVHG